MTPAIKRCSRCCRPKWHSDFNYDSHARDYLQPYCRPCKTDYQRERRRRLRQGQEVPYAAA